MSVLIGFYNILKDNSNVNNLVSGRIYPLKAKQNVPNPCIVINITRTNPTDTKDDLPSKLDICSVMVDVYAKSSDDAFTLSNYVRTALDRVGYNGNGINISKITFVDESGFIDEMADSFRVNQSYTARLKK